jgi:phage baseplate assembly protein W
MPFNPQNINPDDLNPNVAIGVNLPLNGPGVFNSTYITQKAIKNNLINFFLTNPGERPLNPSFGAGLRVFLFEQSNEPTFESLNSFISSKLETFFPEVKILKLDVLSPNDDPNNIVVTLNYSINNTNINDSINIQF